MMVDYKINLVAARANADMTQREVAEKLNINRVTLANWEKGKTKIPFKALINLCNLYNIPIDLICVPDELTSGEEEV